jgi:hypothetical protein
MSDERQLKELQQVARLLHLDDEVSQDTSDVRVPCPLHEDCVASGDNNLFLDFQRGLYACASSGEEGSFQQLVGRLQSGRALVLAPRRELEEIPAEPIDAEFSEVTTAVNPVRKTPPQVYELKQKLPSPEEVRAENERRIEEVRAARAERRRGAGEKAIIIVLALIFVIAGLMAAALSGFANYNAFASTVSDPAQGRVWGAAGIIAAVISFGGFTFVYWHAANKRMWESLRSLVFALIGAGASILGTEIYIQLQQSHAPPPR